MSLLAAAFIILAGMLLTHTVAAMIMGHEGFADELGHAGPWGLLALALLACFAFALMWSGVATSTLAAAALGLATLSVSIAAVVAYVALCLAVLWGPWFGGWSGSDTTTYVLLALLTIIALLAGATAFIRHPLLDTRSRALRAVATWLVLLVLLLGGLTLHQRLCRKPSLDRPVSEAYLVADGTTLLAQTPWHTKVPGGIWSLPLATLKPRLIARAGTGQLLNYDQTLAFRYGFEGMWRYWAANLDTRRLYRLRGEPIAGSPDGRCYVVVHERKIVVQNDRGRVIARPPTSTSDLLFSPDSRYLYFESAPMRLEALDLTTRQTKLVKQLDVPISLADLSPDGQILLAHTDDATNRFRGMLALDLTTGRTQSFPGLGPNANCFIRDHLVWTRYEQASTDQREIRFVNLNTGQITAAISSTQLGNYLPVRLWHQPNVPYAVLEAFDPRESRRLASDQPFTRRLYVTNLDGTNLRYLRTVSQQILGLSATGQILLFEHPHRADSGNTLTYESKRNLTTVDPLTNQERPLLTL